MELTIGANIKRLRTAKNITQEQLSAAMNVSVSILLLFIAPKLLVFAAYSANLSTSPFSYHFQKD